MSFCVSTASIIVPSTKSCDERAVPCNFGNLEDLLAATCFVGSLLLCSEFYIGRSEYAMLL